jgi:arylamine N-acetyltransferase
LRQTGADSKPPRTFPLSDEQENQETLATTSNTEREQETVHTFSEDENTVPKYSSNQEPSIEEPFKLSLPPTKLEHPSHISLAEPFRRVEGRVDFEEYMRRWEAAHQEKCQQVRSTTEALMKTRYNLALRHAMYVGTAFSTPLFTVASRCLQEDVSPTLAPRFLDYLGRIEKLKYDNVNTCRLARV